MTGIDDFARKAREVQIMFGVVHKLGFQAMAQHLIAHGGRISPLQFGMLRMLRYHRMTLSELSRKFQLDPSTLVPSVDGLEQRGLIVRVKDPNDRRRQPLEITAEGDDLLRQMPVDFEHDPLVDGMRHLGEAKVDQLIALMRELIATMPDGDTTLCDIEERMALHQRPNEAKNV